jgi:hypothetical protein
MSTRNTESTASLYWFGPPKSNTLRLVVGVDCLRIGLVFRFKYTRDRLVRLILASRSGRFLDSWSCLVISRRSALGEIHQGLVLYAESWGRDGLGRLGNLLKGLRRSCGPPTRSVGPTDRSAGLLVGRTHLSGTAMSLVGGDPGVLMSHNSQTSFWVECSRMEASQLCCPEIVHSGPKHVLYILLCPKVSEMV